MWGRRYEKRQKARITGSFRPLQNIIEQAKRVEADWRLRSTELTEMLFQKGAGEAETMPDASATASLEFEAETARAAEAPSGVTPVEPAEERGMEEPDSDEDRAQPSSEEALGQEGDGGSIESWMRRRGTVLQRRRCRPTSTVAISRVRQ